MSEPTTNTAAAVATTDKAQAPAARPKQQTTKDLLQSDTFRERIATALPKHLTPDRMIGVALTTLQRTPLLAQCTQGSFFNAMLSLSQFGLEPDGRNAHLIPFRNGKTGQYDVQLIIDYKGLVELAMRSGKVSNIHADVVCENDEFEYNMGEIKAHKIDFKQPRGKVYAVYCICTFKDGTKKTDVMSKDDVEAIRKRSRAGSSGPWVTDWAEMAKKTAFKRLSKWLPLSSEFRDAVQHDDDTLKDITRQVRSTSPLDALRNTETESIGDAEPQPNPKSSVEEDGEYEVPLPFDDPPAETTPKGK